MKSLGICLGASTVTVVEVLKDNEKIEVKDVFLKAHEGNPKKVLSDRLAQINTNNYDSVSRNQVSSYM